MTTPSRPLVSLRGDRAWSIRRLAEEAGVATKTILRIEAGLDVRPSSIARVAKALGVAPMAIEEYVRQRDRAESIKGKRPERGDDP